MANSYHNPSSLFNSTQYGFSQIVTVSSSGKAFHTSGQVALDNNENVMGATLLDQARHSLSNLSIAIQSIGGDLSDVMSLRIYFVQSEFDNIHAISEALKEFYHPEQLPASTWVGVASLARKSFLIEIEAMGFIDN